MFKAKEITWSKFKEMKRDCKLCCGSKMCPEHQKLVDENFEFVENKEWLITNGN